MADVYINCSHKQSGRAVPGPYYLVKHFGIPCKSSLLQFLFLAFSQGSPKDNI